MGGVDDGELVPHIYQGQVVAVLEEQGRDYKTMDLCDKVVMA